MCGKNYDIREGDLFDPSMLFDYTDFGKVLRTLSVLSYTPKSLARGIAGFPASGGQSATFEESIYRQLDEEANEDAYGSINTDYFALMPQNEDIYEELTGFQSQPQPAATRAPLEKRDYCLKELLETEANYVSVLEMLREKFMEPLRPLLGPENTAAIFQGTQDLEEIHKRFHGELREASRPDASTLISDVFIANKTKFLRYGEYCSGLQPAQELIDELCDKDDALSQRVAKCQMEANGGKFKLRDLLSVPMQRILNRCSTATSTAAWSVRSAPCATWRSTSTRSNETTKLCRL